jgi:hypothetical protein
MSFVIECRVLLDGSDLSSSSTSGGTSDLKTNKKPNERIAVEQVKCLELLLTILSPTEDVCVIRSDLKRGSEGKGNIFSAKSTS